jgi:hypothetical protein
MNKWMIIITLAIISMVPMSANAQLEDFEVLFRATAVEAGSISINVTEQAFGDLDGDGFDEVAIQISGVGLTIFNGQDWTVITEFPGGLNSWSFKGFVDFDNNGIDDVVIGWSDVPRTIEVYRYVGHLSGVADDIIPEVSMNRITVTPNPFNPSTTVNYTVTKPGPVTLSVFDIRGRLVDKIFDQEHREAGTFTIEYRPQTASGVYFVHLIAGEEITTTKMVLVK